MTNQEKQQQSFRAIAGTTLDYNGDALSAFAAEGATSTNFNGAFLEWLNIRNDSTKDLPGAMAEFARRQGVAKWSDVGFILPLPSVGWWDAADTSTIDVDTTFTWSDKSGNGNDATATTTQPATGGSIGGRNALTFDGTEFLTAADSVSLSITGDYSFFVVLNSPDSSDHQQILSKYVSTGQDGYRWRLEDVTDLSWVLTNDGGTAEIDVSTSTVPRSTDTYLSVLMDIGNQVSFFIDGAAAGTPAVVKTSITDLSQPLLIGASFGGTEEFVGVMGELIMYNTLQTAAKRIVIEGYFSDKWAI